MDANLFVAKGINVSCRTINGTSCILFEDKKEVVSLNETASIIWEMINGATKVGDLIQESINNFDGDRIFIEKSVISFLEELSTEGAIVFSLEKFEGVMKNV